MKLFNTPIFTATLLAIFACSFAYAQKLPNTQQAGVWAPASIKVDGRADEWNNQFQAYNKSVDGYYTISNDDKNLYLILKVTDPKLESRMLAFGLTFLIQKSGKHSDDKGISITYPSFSKKERPGFNINDAVKASDKEKDSVAKAYNNVLNSRAKQIAVSGIAGLDSVISVYNTDGIKVAGVLDSKMAYTYELAVSLKDLGIDPADAAKLSYHISLGATVASSLARMSNFVVGADGQVSSGGGVNPASFSADFWGDYTLAKK